MSKRRFLVTAALPYSNGRLHVGHIAGAYLPADIYVRYLRSRDEDVRFICGSDDNGVAIEISASKEKTTPAELSARYNKQQAADFEGLGIHFDIYGGTHQPEFVETHNRTSRIFSAGFTTTATS
jgi:methionyl-tRNA synthetase